MNQFKLYQYFSYFQAIDEVSKLTQIKTEQVFQVLIYLRYRNPRYFKLLLRHQSENRIWDSFSISPKPHSLNFWMCSYQPAQALSCANKQIWPLDQKDITCVWGPNVWFACVLIKSTLQHLFFEINSTPASLIIEWSPFAHINIFPFIILCHSD